MSLVFRIAYAAYGKGTHHKLALDALNRLGGADAEAWRRMFLVHAETYASSCKIPDDKFKDFKNHVLHPRDGYWGGAPLACRQWYDTLVAELKAARWAEAVGAAGILSHYLADPLHPFHTAQSEAENTLHRACEWSISRAYDSLYADGTKSHPDFIRRPMRDPNWLARLVCESADLANASYEKLIAHYDFGRGVSDPPSGLDAVARRICAELLVTAAATIAAVFDRAIEDAGVKPPTVSPTVATMLAAIKIPVAQVLKKISDAAERKQVQAIFDELRATGTVVANLPEENRVIRDLYASEVTVHKPKADIVAMFPAAAAQATPYALPDGKQMPKRSAPMAAIPAAIAAVEPQHVAPVAKAPVAQSEMPSSAKSSRRALSLDADVVDAPSIGPKTAERLYSRGVKTIADLLAAKPAQLVAAIDQRHITVATITDWQDLTRLVMEMPGLNGTQAQLLVGSGYRSRAAVGQATPQKLCADVAAFAATAVGRRVLHDGGAPSADKVAAWQKLAATLQAA